MKNFFQKYWVHCACAAVWVASAILVVSMYVELNRQQPSMSITEDMCATIVYEEEEKDATHIIEEDAFLKRNIAFCKSETLANVVLEKSRKYQIEPYVIYALIATESGGSSHSMNEKNIMSDVVYDAVSSANCIGLTQVSAYALADYNKANDTSYMIDDLYDIDTNIEVGVWHFCRFRNYEETLVGLYIIYNVGYTEYTSMNSNWFYGWDGKWYSDYQNKFFYMNGMYPPTKAMNYKRGLYGKNALPKYSPKGRFEKCLSICMEQLQR